MCLRFSVRVGIKHQGQEAAMNVRATNKVEKIKRVLKAVGKQQFGQKFERPLADLI